VWLHESQNELIACESQESFSQYRFLKSRIRFAPAAPLSMMTLEFGPS
jgi:hypothetical protein